MKTRSGFVSNSSSSSFVLALRKTNPCPHCGRSDPNFLDMIRTRGAEINDDNMVTSEGIEKVLADVKSYLVDPNELTQMRTALKLYSDDEIWVVASISLSNHDEVLVKLMDELIKKGNAVKIWGETDW